MPKIIKWAGTSAEDINGAEERDYDGYEPYDGPMPPRGMILACKIKRITAEKFNSGNFGVNILAEVDESGSKAKYNGLAYWKSITDTPETTWLIKQFLKAVGSKNPGSDWHKTAIEEQDGKRVVVKFGSLRIETLRVGVVHKNGKDQNGDPKADVQRFVPAAQSASASAGKARSNADEDDDADATDDAVTQEAPF